jgi:hypothetical protein
VQLKVELHNGWHTAGVIPQPTWEHGQEDVVAPAMMDVQLVLGELDVVFDLRLREQALH